MKTYELIKKYILNNKILKYLYFKYRSIVTFPNNLYHIVLFRIKNVSIGKDFRIRGKISIKNPGSIIIGDNFLANSGLKYNNIGPDRVLRFITQGKGKITIEDNVGITNSIFYSSSSITISSGVFIGAGCKVWDTDFHSLDPKIRGTKDDHGINVKSSPIFIAEKAFIGGNVSILKGVQIGRNSIVAAGSVVFNSIPENEIWGGNPAKKIVSLSFFVKNL